MFNSLKLFLILSIWISSQMVMGDVTFKVVSSNLPEEYPIGKMLTEKTEINLKLGDKIQVEITKGNKKVIYTFDGPYDADKKTDKKSDGLIKTIREIFGNKRPIIAKYEQLKNSELLVVSEDSNFCYASDAPLKLWRPDAKTKIEVSINETTLKWDAKQDMLEISVDKLPTTGNIHLAKIIKSSSTKKSPLFIKLHKMPTKLISNTSKGKWMLGKNCVRQAKIIFQMEQPK
ncbi:hypothetical protein QUF74_00080 [Candidatus Halobeggiatoa sp. HSG11]|nr:hypothetical protein [Candidatus Halobeggiatoa sp. HSG11]